MNFSEQFKQLENLTAMIILEHILFDSQVFQVDKLKIINDNDRIGLVLQNQEIFIYKKDVTLSTIQNNFYILESKNLNITIIVNNL